jgi:hypothetical protein
MLLDATPPFFTHVMNIISMQVCFRDVSNRNLLCSECVPHYSYMSRLVMSLETRGLTERRESVVSSIAPYREATRWSLVLRLVLLTDFSVPPGHFFSHPSQFRLAQ